MSREKHLAHKTTDIIQLKMGLVCYQVFKKDKPPKGSARQDLFHLNVLDKFYSTNKAV